MKEKFLNSINMIISDVQNGNTSIDEAHELLTELNHTAFNLVHFKIDAELDTNEIQIAIHAAQDELIAL